MNPRPLVFGLAALLLSCGGSSEGGSPAQPLDCAWLASEDNCYRTTLAAAQGCLPEVPSSQGTLSGDRASCTYASGHTIIFDAPLAFPLDSQVKVSYRVAAADGGECLRFQQTDTEFMRITTSAGTFVERSSADAGVSITCPDGSVFSAPDGRALMDECNGGAGGGLPGRVRISTGNNLSFSFLNGPGGESLRVFACGE